MRKKKGNTRTKTVTWVSASLAVLAAGTLLSYSQKSWPFKGRKQQGAQGGGAQDATNTPATSTTGSQPTDSDKNSKAGSSRKSGGASAKGGTTPKVDVALNNEVASATQSSPGTENNFTDEGATGNND